eukprot:TRINITY_DN81022_c0_g1_i1.p1 TRINITY_DN81022_c0_g1~~TRINITY_DN81022_c0_g1_i1.p1  ORF type:complete len:405 (+),score=57.32 TRINITY_DN81022_c0_g1_i1:72-1286(+)
MAQGQSLELGAGPTKVVEGSHQRSSTPIVRERKSNADGPKQKNGTTATPEPSEPKNQKDELEAEKKAQEDVSAKKSASLPAAAVVAIWFFSSILFNISAPRLLALLPDAEDMTVLELLVTVLVGSVSLKLRGMRLLPPGGVRAYPAAALLGVIHLFNCRCYVYSLQFIPTALAQTIRATNPLWVVAASLLFLQKTFALPVLLSLAPLVGGFALAVGAEPSGLANPLGLAAAVASVNAQVGTNMLGQRRMLKDGKDSGNAAHAPPHPFELQFRSCLFALIALLPIWLLGGGVGRMANHWNSVSLPIRYEILCMTVLDGVLYYTEQSASFSALQSYRPLTFAVIDTVRRLSIVVIAGFIVQGTVLTLSKAVGIFLVICGGLTFAYATDQEKQKVSMSMEPKTTKMM